MVIEVVRVQSCLVDDGVLLDRCPRRGRRQSLWVSACVADWTSSAPSRPPFSDARKKIDHTTCFITSRWRPLAIFLILFLDRPEALTKRLRVTEHCEEAFGGEGQTAHPKPKELHLCQEHVQRDVTEHSLANFV